MVLFDRQVARLDAFGTGKRRWKGKPLSRAEIIRALVDAVIESGLEVTNATSEADLRGLVAQRLRSR